MSELLVIGYPDEETADRVWNEIVSMQKDYLIDIADGAIIRRDPDGRFHVTTPAHHAVAWGTLSGLFWGTLIGLIFLFPLAPLGGLVGGLMGAALGKAEELGIKDDFKQRVSDLVRPGSSAIMVVVRRATPDKVVEALQPFGGTILRTSLTHEAEQKLMKALHGDDASKATWLQGPESAQRIA